MLARNRIFCEKTNRLHLTMLIYNRAKVNTKWQGTVHNPPFSFLYYIIKGSALIETEAGTLRLKEGHWYLLPSRCSFRYLCEDFMDHIYFHFTLNDRENLDLLSQCQKPLTMAPCPLPAVIEEGLTGAKDIISSLSVRCALYETLLSILKENKIELKTPALSPLVQGAVAYIQKNLSAKLTTTGIAQAMFVSKSTLTKHFKKELSMSVQEYLYDVLLSEASRLLLKGNRSVQEISEKLGFSDQFYFSRRFKEKYGNAPREYKKLFV